MRAIIRSGVSAALAAAWLTGPALAGPITEGVYRLGNHPDGTERPPGYGLRLDGLTGDPADVFTFDFEHPSSRMLMRYDAQAATVRIFGKVVGGLDIGSDLSSDPEMVGLWSVDYTYHDVRSAAGDDDIVAGPDLTTNAGVLKRHFASNAYAESYTLIDYPPSADWTFRVGDADGDTGYRGFPGTSGWGWMTHDGYHTHAHSSAWLFTITGVENVTVPSPGAAMLGVVGLAVVGRRWRDA